MFIVAVLFYLLPVFLQLLATRTVDSGLWIYLVGGAIGLVLLYLWRDRDNVIK